MQLIDIGANLTHQSFAHDFAQVRDAAHNAGVSHIILTGTDLESSQAALALARADAGFSCTAGFHPHVASSCGPAEIDQIAELTNHPQLVAIGETGLDFNRNFSPHDTQRDVFERHLQLAVSRQMPLFLHQRDAHGAFIELLSQYRSQLCGGVVHCFTDTAEALQDYLDLDMYIGITGWICDERRGKELQGLVARIPADRLLLETDAPYLLPRTLTPKPASRRNEPKYLREILRMTAACRGCSAGQLASETTANALRLFGPRLQSGDGIVPAVT